METRELPQIISVKGDTYIVRDKEVIEANTITSVPSSSYILLLDKDNKVYKASYSKAKSWTGGIKNNAHAYVDMGLPSGKLWGTMNVGATTETEPGLFFAWADITGYTAEQVANGVKQFSRYDYVYLDSDDNFSKYTYDGDYISELELMDDAARVHWKGNWRVPSTTEFTELFNNSSYAFETRDGVNGLTLTSKINGNKLFFPTTGFAMNGEVKNLTTIGSCWARDTYWGNSMLMQGMFFTYPESVTPNGIDARYLGFSIRPILIP